MKKFVRVLALLLIAAMFCTTALASEYEPIQNRYLPGWHQEAFGYREVGMTEDWVDETGKTIGTKTSSYKFNEKGNRVEENRSEVDLVEDLKEYYRDTYTFDSNGDHTKTVSYYSDESVAALKEDMISTYEYDAVGRPVKTTETNADGEITYVNVMEYYGDSWDYLEDVYYDGPVAEENLSRKVTYEYDSDGNTTGRKSVDYIEGEEVSSDEYTYNADGLETEWIYSYKDEDGETVVVKTTYTYDDDRNRIKEDCGTLGTTHTYDKNGNCVKSVTKDGDQETEVVTREYNEYGQPTLECFEDKLTDTTYKYEYTYDDNGNQLAYFYDGELEQKWTYSGNNVMTEEYVSSGEIIKYTYDSNGNCTELKYYIRNEAGKEILQATRKIEYEICAEGISFQDVTAEDWFAAPVIWASDWGITTGVGDGSEFAPGRTCTRAEVVTFLWRMVGEPAPESEESAFVDVEEDSWYTNAVLWAAENGITTGKDSTHFDPTGIVSRAELVTFLSRLAGVEEFEGENSFSDVKEGSWYENAVLWAVDNTITTGKPGGIFDPTGNCSRSETVTFLYRYYW